jgi:putative ABC transport system substrate-binding protein
MNCRGAEVKKGRGAMTRQGEDKTVRGRRQRTWGMYIALAFGLLAAPFAAYAQRPVETHRIGTLGSNPSPAAAPLWEDFRQGLRECGYVEGQNILIEPRSAEGKYERLPELAAELVRLRVSVIVAGGTPATHAARRATQTIPIVCPIAGDPVDQGFVSTLARPGGNITGLANMAPDLVGKQLQLLKEVVPKVSRVALLWNPATSIGPFQFREAEVAARALGVRLQSVTVRGPDELAGAFSAMARERAGALLVTTDPLLLSHRTRLADLASKNRLPAMYGLTEHVEAEGLMS